MWSVGVVSMPGNWQTAPPTPHNPQQGVGIGGRSLGGSVSETSESRCSYFYPSRTALHVLVQPSCGTHSTQP